MPFKYHWFAPLALDTNSLQLFLLMDGVAGFEFTVTVTLAVFVAPSASVPVTVYVVLTEGLAITVAPVVVFNPVAGDHVYVFAPFAVNVADEPPHTEGLDGEITTAFSVQLPLGHH